MKKIFLFFAVCCQLLISSCSSDDASGEANMSFEKNIDAVPVLCGYNGTAPYAAMLTKDGELKGRFDCMPSFSVNGIFRVLIGTPVASPNGGAAHIVYDCVLFSLSDCKPIGGPFEDTGYYVDGCIPVLKKDDKYAVVDNKAETKFYLNETTGKTVKSCGTFYSCKRLAVKIDGQGWGFVDTKGKIVVEPAYDSVTWYMNGYALCEQSKDDNTTVTILDTKGNEVSKFADVDDVAFFNGKYVALKNDEKFLIFNMKGEKQAVISDDQVKDIYDIADNRIIFRGPCKYVGQGTGSGVMNFDGKIVIGVSYDNLFMLGSEYLSVGRESIILLGKDGEEKHYEHIVANAFEYYPQIGILAGQKIEEKNYGQINVNLPIQAFDVRDAYLYNTDGKKMEEVPFCFQKTKIKYTL